MRATFAGLVLVGSVLCAAVLVACGGPAHPDIPVSVFDEGGVVAPGPDATALAAAEGGTQFFIPDGAIPDATTTIALDVNGPLAIALSSSAVDVTYGQSSPTVTASATVNGYGVAASFSVDRGEVGSIAPSTGVLTPTGLVGGVVTITATFGGQTASAAVTVTLHLVQNGAQANPGVGDAGPSDAATSDASLDGAADAGNGLGANGTGGNGGVGGEGAGGSVDAGTLAVLQGTPAADPSLAFLYPYDETVWPRGLLAPLLQWSTSLSYDAVAIHLAETGFVYDGYFASTASPFVHHPIPQSVWDTMAYSNQGDNVTVSLVFEAGGVAYGPVTETWQIAATSLTGTVYYNSYGTNLAQNYCCTKNGAAFGGATLAIRHGATDPVLVAGNNSECRVCHSVSANGSTLVTSQGPGDFTSSVYALTGGLVETTLSPGDGRYNWGALYPDGTFLLANDGPAQAAWGGSATQLFAVADDAGPGDGGPIPSHGLPANLEVGSPVFSPDGLHVAFNFYGGAAPDGGAADGKSLAMMDFDVTTKTFSNFQTLYTPPTGYSVWPSFVPTGAAVVFEVELQSNGEWGETRQCPGSASCSNLGVQAQLWWVDVPSKMAAPLTMLNGGTYLPSNPDGGHPDDEILNYEPTVNPVAGGGYAWVVFTSRRTYGNVATIPPYESDPRYFDISITPTTKKLWVAAIDLHATPGTDPSHPAFYLPGQELLAGNSRGYWVVDACEPNGASCLTGDQCCGGYCSEIDGGLVCSDQPPACSTEFDKCTQTSDCCGASKGMQCIARRCATSTPPPPPPPPVP